MSNEVIHDPSHNDLTDTNIITQVESGDHLSQFPVEDDVEPHGISTPAVISSEIVLCLYEALEFLDLSYFDISSSMYHGVPTILSRSPMYYDPQ